MTDIDWKYADNDIPKCPHCDFQDEDYWEVVDFEDDALAEVHCSNCGEEYEIITHASYSFSTYKKEESK